MGGVEEVCVRPDEPAVGEYLKKTKLQRDCDCVLVCLLACRFKTAIDVFFKWALVVNPKHHYALMNYALLHQLVTKDYDRAETYYR
jgi:hypothetical protein